LKERFAVVIVTDAALHLWVLLDIRALLWSFLVILKVPCCKEAFTAEGKSIKISREKRRKRRKE
jgi:hypothetical protein